MPSMLKYKGELYAKVIDSDSEGVEIVENSTIKNPAQEHGVSENASDILQKIENLQHELTAEIEKLKAIEAHSRGYSLLDSSETLSHSEIRQKAQSLEHNIQTICERVLKEIPHTHLKVNGDILKMSLLFSKYPNDLRMLESEIAKEIKKHFVAKNLNMKLFSHSATSGATIEIEWNL